MEKCICCVEGVGKDTDPRQLSPFGREPELDHLSIARSQQNSTQSGFCRGTHCLPLVTAMVEASKSLQRTMCLYICTDMSPHL